MLRRYRGLRPSRARHLTVPSAGPGPCRLTRGLPVDLVWQAIRDAVELIDWADADLMRIVWLSLIVLGAAAVPAVNGR